MSEQTPQQLAWMDWPWKQEDPGAHIILVSDEQLINLAEHPDEAVEKVHPQAETPISLREHCRRSAARGATKMRVAFDYFFGGSERSLYPDTETFQDALKKIHDVAAEYGIGLEPSIISPLELGVGYHAETGEAGRWMHYREGLRDPQTGMYSVMMWQHNRWCNNKGPMPVKLVGARVFAFAETRVPGTAFFAVPPASIVELATPEIETLPGAGVEVGALDGGVAELDAMFQATRIRVHGTGGAQGLDRVLVVLLYETVEMDYFSPSAPAFLDRLVKAYHARGITLAGVYSDEMHIQQDWSYHTHFDNGQFTVRYVSAGFERAFAAKFGAEYEDFAKYMVYFTAHQHDFLPTHEPKLPSQHVYGASAEAIAETLHFRRDYYDFLERTVVDLMVEARDTLEALNGHDLDLFYHATWAESPTCDAWAPGGVHRSWSADEHNRRYAYTPDFLWSNTIQQASAACANYFLWNDFLTGGNNDTAEGGYADRNYYGRALACSLAALNRRPLASAGMWGMPPEVRRRMTAVSEVYGAGGHPIYRSVADYAPRQSEVLFLYPQDLVAVEERFGSWMVLYGYANYATAEKLVANGTVTDDGRMAVIDARYRAVCVLYEPFPTEDLLALLRSFAEKGGTVIWSGTPPLVSAARAVLEACAGATYVPLVDPMGLPLPSRQVTFQGDLSSVPNQMVLTDFVVDRVFPLTAHEGTEKVARLPTGGPRGSVCVGTRKVTPGGGQIVLLGFRPEDDQSASTGVEIRTWFEILNALGVYAGEGNPAVVSRSTEYLVATFPNGAVALCPHYRDHPESWPGGFYRDKEEDARLLAENPVPDDEIALEDLCVAAHTVHYRGRHAVAWRLAPGGAGPAGARLVSFAGSACTGIEVNGIEYAWSEVPVDIAWHSLGESYATEAATPLYRVWVGSTGRVRLPMRLGEQVIEVWQGTYVSSAVPVAAPVHLCVGQGLAKVAFGIERGDLVLDIDETLAGHWLYVTQPSG